MTVLSDGEIKKAIHSGEIVIDPYDEKKVQPASYDMKIGRVLKAGRGIIDPKKERVVLRTGEWAEIETLESIKLSASLSAQYGIRSSITRIGIDWFGGPQIDPGYEGRIYVSLFNPSSQAFEIEHGKPFCTVIFHRLGQEAEKIYSGSYTKQFSFPEEDVERMVKMSSPTLADVVISVGTLEETVVKLTQQMTKLTTDTGWIKNILFAILIAIVVGIGAAMCNSFF